jgi:hypothetical protein
MRSREGLLGPMAARRRLEEKIMYGDFFYRLAEMRRLRRLQRLTDGMPDYLLRDLGFERDGRGRVYRIPMEPKT